MEIDNLIIIKYGSHSDIKKTLIQWIKERFEDVNIDFVFELYKYERENYIIKADERITNRYFCELINYLFRFLKKTNRRIEIEGFTTWRDDIKLGNEKILVYVLPDNWKDSTYLVSSTNKNYRIHYYEENSKKEIEEVRKYKYPDNIKLNNPEILKRDQILQLEKEKSEKITTIRFFVILSIAIILFLPLLLQLLQVLRLNLPLENYCDTKIFTDVISHIGIGLGIWYLMDYKMLRIDRLYNLSLIISIIYLVSGLTLIWKIAPNCEIGFGLLYPLVLLLTQKTARKIFLQIMKKEPEINTHGPISFGIYSMCLFLIPIVLVFFIKDIII
jgi:hypothetical protein